MTSQRQSVGTVEQVGMAKMIGMSTAGGHNLTYDPLTPLFVENNPTTKRA